jgi:pimeloyl-ACP methyl ester carboxylesterase
MRRIQLEERGLVGFDNGPSEARPILLLHGFPDLPRGYFPLMERFEAAGRRTVAPYLRGYAPSTVEGMTSFDVLAADLLAWADALSPDEPVDVVGHDWGSVIVQRACLLRPDRFRRACLMSVPHLLAMSRGVARQPSQLWRSRYMLHFQAGRLADAWVRARGYRYVRDLWRRWSPSLASDEDYFRELRACFDASWPAPVSYYRVARKPGTWPHSMVWRPELPRDAITVPTLYLHGAEDGCVGAGLARGQERFFTGGLESHTLEGAGHFLHVEDPESVFQAMAPFFGPG